VNYWLLKSEPGTFSIDDLAAQLGKTTSWDGVRNYQARNMLRDSIKKGDAAFFYHSSCAEPGIAGVVQMVKGGHPDASALDSSDDHYDPEATPDEPRWYSVDVKLKRKFAAVITLEVLRKHADSALQDLLVLKRGNRLSVMPVTKKNWEFVLSLE